MPDDLNQTTGAGFAPRRAAQTAVDRFQVPSSTLFGDVKKAATDPLDGPRAKQLFDRMISHYLRELDNQAKWRRDMERDAAFYDNDQWQPEDIATLRGRGQEPMVFNVIAQSINWILGTERRGRTDYKILPRSKEAAKAAEKKTQVFKYLDDANMSEFHWSRAFSDACRAGLGWIECGLRDEDEGEPIYDSFESWRNIIYDTAALNFDLSDGRYTFRTKWVDVDTALAMFPDREGIIKAASYAINEYGAALDRMGDDAMDSREEATASEGYSSLDSPSYTRKRVRLIEAWFRVTENAERMKGGDFSGELYDPASPGHVEAVEGGQSEVITKITHRMYVMLMTTTGPLYLAQSPYRHNRYPFTPIWAYRKDADGSPYGPVRGMVDAQKDVNKRFSKAQFILNTNRVIMEEGAVEDKENLAEEVARPDGIITYKKGYHLELGTDRELSAAHLNLMQVSMGMIQSLSGVTDESMGRTTNATSGKAIIARQEQGALATAPLFDNLRMARAFHGEKRLSLVEQFMSEQKQFRVTNQRGNPDYVTINDGLPENDIVRTKADFKISEAEFNATARQAQAEALLNVVLQLAPVAPQLALLLLDLIVEKMDIPNGEEIVKRIRSITGAEDPEADPENPTPEMQARAQAKAAEAQMAQRAAEANVAKIEGEAALKLSQAEKYKVDAEKVIRSLPKDTLDNFANALQIAIQMLQAAGAVDTADALIAVANAAPAAQPAAPMAGVPMPQGALMAPEQPMPGQPMPVDPGMMPV